MTGLGIKRLIVWECTINKMNRNEEYADVMLKQMVDFLTSDSMNMEL